MLWIEPTMSLQAAASIGLEGRSRGIQSFAAWKMRANHVLMANGAYESSRAILVVPTLHRQVEQTYTKESPYAPTLIFCMA